MEIGIGAPVSGAWAGPEQLARFGGLAEELGYSSLWTFQRLLAPADGGGDPVYRSVLDPLLSLAYAAAHTSRVRLGVAVLNAPFLSPAYLAKQASTLDVLSGGRFDLGLGLGWSPLEFAATGAETAARGKRLEEYVAVLRALWSPGPTAFDGEFYQVPESRMEPKPVQPGGPPILLGGVVPAALARAGRLADGWLSRSGTVLAGIADEIAVVRTAAEQAGRDPAALRVATRGVVRYDPSGKGAVDAEGRRLRLSGTAEQIAEDAGWLAEQGVTDLFYDLNWDPRIGDPAAEPAAAAERAEEIIRALAPNEGAQGVSEAEDNARRRGMNEEIIAEFRANDGRVGGLYDETDLLLLHHVGAKSGAAYVAPLAYLPYGGSYVLMAANGGRPKHPGWYFNLSAHPEASVEVAGRTIAVRAREATGAEREELLARARDESKFFGAFETRAPRPIPFLVLEPVIGAPPRR